ncbi:MAG: helix-turn-helix domain-containing protein [Clostridiales bacterium]|nr:helix-turn-helix domain-containing protein [Clostridiales bacterium]
MKYPNIDAERVRNGMTQDELAQKLGVTRKTIYNWCSKGKIPQSKLEEMAALFGNCSIDYLLGLTPTDHPTGQ